MRGDLLSFSESIIALLGNAFDYKDSSPRSEYWYSVTFFIFLNIVMNFIFSILSLKSKVQVQVFIVSFLSLISVFSPSSIISFLMGVKTHIAILIIGILLLFLILYLISMSLSLVVRRFHDAGHSGLWILLPIAITISTYILIFCFPKMVTTIFIDGNIVNVIVSLIFFVITLMPSKFDGNKYQKPDPFYKQAMTEGEYKRYGKY